MEADYEIGAINQMAHPLENIMQSTMEQLRQLTAVEAVIGKPVHVNEDTCIIPVSRASLGFVTGGGEYGVKSPVMESGHSLDCDGRPFPFAGTMTAGVSVAPIAFLTVTEGNVRMLPVAEREPYARVAALLPDLMHEAIALIRSLREETSE